MIHELRIYTVNTGKMPTVLARFRDHTVRLFERHGIRSVGYWHVTIGGRSDQLWYLLGFDDLLQRERSWSEFRADPEWQLALAESEKDGPLVRRVETKILTPTDFSPLR